MNASEIAGLVDDASSGGSGRSSRQRARQSASARSIPRRAVAGLLVAMFTVVGCYGSSSDDADAGSDVSSSMGSQGGPCYANDTCDGTLACDRGVCAVDDSTPGSLGGTCDTSLPCSAALSCPGGRCVDSAAPAGSNGADCSVDGMCNSGLTCRFGVCLDVPPATGTRGGECRDDGTCDSGLDCEAGLCVAPTTNTPMTEADRARLAEEWRSVETQDCQKMYECNPWDDPADVLQSELADCISAIDDSVNDEFAAASGLSRECVETTLEYGRCALELNCTGYTELLEYWNADIEIPEGGERAFLANSPHCSAEGVIWHDSCF